MLSGSIREVFHGLHGSLEVFAATVNNASKMLSNLVNRLLVHKFEFNFDLREMSQLSLEILDQFAIGIVLTFVT